jgi:hypothetical protein
VVLQVLLVLVALLVQKPREIPEQLDYQKHQMVLVVQKALELRVVLERLVGQMLHLFHLVLPVPQALLVQQDQGDLLIPCLLGIQPLLMVLVALAIHWVQGHRLHLLGLVIQQSQGVQVNLKVPRVRTVLWVLENRLVQEILMLPHLLEVRVVLEVLAGLEDQRLHLVQFLQDLLEVQMGQADQMVQQVLEGLETQQFQMDLVFQMVLENLKVLLVQQLLADPVDRMVLAVQKDQLVQ